MINQIINIDVLEGLKQLADESINCCITSPPYYGLRDYGTAKWKGGDLKCNHEEARHKNRYDYECSDFQLGNKASAVSSYEDVCPKCGAKRIDKQIGLEETPEQYVARLADIFDEVKRVLKSDGTIWLNLGDSYVSGKSRYSTIEQSILGGGTNDEKYGGLQHGGKKDFRNHPVYKDKDLFGIPWMVAFELRKRGWWLRQDIIWYKRNPMPESVQDRCTKAHEYVFLLSKSAVYYFDHRAIQEKSINADPKRNTTINCVKYNDVPGQTPNSFGHKRWQENDDGEMVHNKRSVWETVAEPSKEIHFAAFPVKLVEPMIKAGCPKGGTVLDPFMGSGTTAVVAKRLGCSYVGFDLNPEYVKISEKRLSNVIDI